MTPHQRKLLEALWPSYLNVVYVWGGSNPSEGLDCSGLVIEILTSLGAVPPGFDTTSQGLFKQFSAFEPGEVDFGDLVFFGASETSITHVAMCLGEGYMLEAGGGSRKMATREDGIRGNGRVRIRPIKARKDVVGYRRPKY